MLNVYMNPVSSNSQKVLFFLEEHKVPFKPHVINLAKGEQTTDAFTSLNPFSAVPAIEDNGFRLAESAAILRYLAQKLRLHTVYPDNLEERARIDQALDFTMIHLHRWTASLVYNQIILPMIGQKPNLAIVEDSRATLLRYLPRLERYLATSSATTFLCGPHLTIADCAFVPCVASFARVGVDLRDFPLTAAYTRRMTERPAWVKVQGDAMKAMKA